MASIGPSDATQTALTVNSLAEAAETSAQGQTLSGGSQLSDAQRGNNYTENINESTQSAMGDVTGRGEAGRAMVEHQTFDAYLTDLTQSKGANTKKAGGAIAATAG